MSVEVEKKHKNKTLCLEKTPGILFWRGIRPFPPQILIGQLLQSLQDKKQR